MIKLSFEYVWIGPRGAELDVHLVASEFAPMLSTHDHQGRRALWIDHHQPSNCFAAESSLDLGVGWQMMAATKTEIKKGTVLACTRCSTVFMHIYEVIYAMRSAMRMQCTSKRWCSNCWNLVLFQSGQATPGTRFGYDIAPDRCTICEAEWNPHIISYQYPFGWL